MIFITHPKHGAHNINSGQLEEHLKNGWKVSTPEEWISEKVDPDKPKRGRPAKAVEERKEQIGKK